MKINLTPNTPENPILIDLTEYERLKVKKNGGWSNCETVLEWLVKLHYLRNGFQENKLSEKDFLKRESLLVQQWWAKWV